MSHVSETVWSFDVKNCTLTWQTQKCLRTKFCAPKFRNKKVIEWPNLELWSRFSQNLWTLVHIFRHCWKSQVTKIVWTKVQKQESYEGSNFDDDSDVLEIVELWSIYFNVFGKPSGRATSHQNFVGLSSEAKKLLSDQILNFGLDFLKIAELWSTYFGIVRKHWGRATSHQNFVDQSSKTRKLLGDQFLNFGPDFLETSELWSTSFSIFRKIPERPTAC